jgi:hypothetical protein
VNSFDKTSVREGPEATADSRATWNRDFRSEIVCQIGAICQELRSQLNDGQVPVDVLGATQIDFFHEPIGVAPKGIDVIAVVIEYGYAFSFREEKPESVSDSHHPRFTTRVIQVEDSSVPGKVFDRIPCNNGDVLPPPQPNLRPSRNFLVYLKSYDSVGPVMTQPPINHPSLPTPDVNQDVAIFDSFLEYETQRRIVSVDGVVDPKRRVWRRVTAAEKSTVSQVEQNIASQSHSIPDQDSRRKHRFGLLASADLLSIPTDLLEYIISGMRGSTASSLQFRLVKPPTKL